MIEGCLFLIWFTQLITLFVTPTHGNEELLTELRWIRRELQKMSGSSKL